MALYLCVDCGGTKTAAAIANSRGEIIARGSGGPSNITYLTPEAFIRAVSDAVSSALLSLPNPISPNLPIPPNTPSPFAAAWFGISGADSLSAIASVASHLSTLLKLPLGKRLAIANDTHLLAAPLRMYAEMESAVAVIAGTGSIGVGFRRGSGGDEGQLVECGRVGGWGWVLGDEGGGFSVGREALRQILMENDIASVDASASGKGAGVEKPTRGVLVESVLRRFGVSDVLEILTGVYAPDPALNNPSGTIVATPNDPSSTTSNTTQGQIPTPLIPIPTKDLQEPSLLHLPREKRLSSLAPLIFDAAFVHHDPLALRILTTTAGQLAAQISILLSIDSDTPTNPAVNGTNMGIGKGVNPSKSVICFGGSLVGVPAYRDLILTDLARRGAVFGRVVYVSEPAGEGARGLAVAFEGSSANT